jgi:hypothetical protein
MLESEFDVAKVPLSTMSENAAAVVGTSLLSQCYCC